MSHVDPDDPDEKPLDPELEKVRRKMMRLLTVSIGIMFVGVMAVLAAVVYRVAGSGEEPETVAGASSGFSVPGDEPLSARAALPAGFSVQDVALDGGTILFFGEDGDGARRAFLFDLEAGRIVAEIAIGE